MRIDGISPDQAMEALDITLRRHPVQIGIMRMDWQNIYKVLPNKRVAQRFSSLIGENQTDEDAAEATIRIKERLQEAKTEERHDIVESYIREQVAKVLGTSASRLELDRPLNDLGLDSLMAVELKNRIEADVQLSLSAGRLVQGPTIQEIAADVLELLAAPARTGAEPPTIRRQPVEQRSANVDQLSDYEVESLLKEMLEKDASMADYAQEERKRY
jgi:acyl carrier protein